MLIDNIFVNNEYVRSLKSLVLIDDISDHLPTCTILENVSIGLKEKKKVVTRKLTNNNIKLIQSELQQMNWNNYLETHCTNTTNVDSAFNYVHNKICESVNKHAPMKEKIVNIGKLRSKPWMTPGIKHSSQETKKNVQIVLKTGRNSLCSRNIYTV